MSPVIPSQENALQRNDERSNAWRSQRTKQRNAWVGVAGDGVVLMFTKEISAGAPWPDGSLQTDYRNDALHGYVSQGVVATRLTD